MIHKDESADIEIQDNKHIFATKDIFYVVGSKSGNA